MRRQLLLFLLLASSVPYIAHAQESRPNPILTALNEAAHNPKVWLGLVLMVLVALFFARTRNN
jgi:predicted MFS family arabinose efflux permease